MINSVYGKTMENLRQIINIRLAYNCQTDKDLAAIYEIKPVLTLDKPIYVGFSVLDLSKLKMYNFYYNYTKKNMIIMLICYLLTQIV